MATYLRPNTLNEALETLALDAAAAHADPLDRPIPFAGGTDFYPAAATRQAWFQPSPRNVIDVSAIAELRGLRRESDGFRFGALTTWEQIATATLPTAFDGLRQAARQVGGAQIQNRGTLGGNICNASPAADGVPPLLALDAEVELASLSGSRRMPLARFILGNRRTALESGALLTAIHVPPPADGERSVFLKLGARAYLVISIASVAANIALDSRGRIARARVAVGACSAAPQRLPALEDRLIGGRPEAASRTIEDAMLAVLDPIDDVRASAAYRKHAALVLVRRALDELTTVRELAA